MSSLLRLKSTALCMRLSNREKKHHYKTLTLLNSLWQDLSSFSKLIKRVDYQFPENFKLMEIQLSKKTDSNSYKGKLEFILKNDFHLPTLSRPWLAKLYKFLELFFSLICSSSIDTDTRISMIKTAVKSGLGNPFFDLAKDKNLKHIAKNLDLQNLLLKFVKCQLKFIRGNKNSILSEYNFQIIRLTFSFFSQLKQVFLFDAGECLEVLNLSCPRESLRLYLMDRLVSLHKLSKEEVLELKAIPLATLTNCVKTGNFGFYKNLLKHRNIKISTSELSILTNKIAISMRQGNELHFNSFGQIVINVIKSKYKMLQADFSLNLILDPMLGRLKEAFKFRRKKTQGLSPKILEKYLTFLCSLTCLAIQKKEDKEKKEKELENKIVEESESPKPKSKITLEIILKYNSILTNFAIESLYLLLISKFSEKFLLPVVVENLSILDPSFPQALISRLEKFLQMDNINLQYFLTSIYWILDWLFEQGQFELIIKIFKGASAALSRLDKTAKKKVFQVCFYILFRVATLQGIAKGSLKSLNAEISSRFQVNKKCDFQEFESEYSQIVSDVLSNSNTLELAKKMQNSPFNSSIGNLLESYPDLFESFAKEEETLGTCFYSLFPPKLHLNDDYCLEPENVKKILDLITEQMMKKCVEYNVHWFNEETRFILKKLSELYPSAFKSWFKKFIEKNLKLTKKAKIPTNITATTIVRTSLFSI